ncbi:MAG: family 10 glycosylhydrolase [Chloroflexi bacterium]|nr:family 10 glycosylhydrolase [Chloroflexota bacterium]
MKKSFFLLALPWFLLFGAAVWVQTSPVASQINPTSASYLPYIERALPTPTFTPSPTPSPTPTPTATPSGAMVEMRGLWITRFDWTVFNQPASPAKIDEMVDNAAYAGFNVIFFQVRGTADAYYTPGLEPWAQRISGGTLGQAPDPYWDPLQRLIERAHANGIQVHAYVNVYPLWDCGTTPSAAASPQHLYYKVRDYHGQTNGHLNGVQWAGQTGTQCSSYLRTSPASIFVDDHLMAVANDLASRYDLDGLHLDHIRYGGSNASCDPVSMFYWGGSCFGAGYADWQRQQVNGTVRRFYDDVIAQHPDMLFSAAVWPIHIDKWGWGATQGYHSYYQDSKAWQAGGYIDAIMPMIYPSNFDTDTFWTLEKWRTLVQDFMGESSGRWVIPGIGTGYSDFAQIEARINSAREFGTAGHALFSYGDLYRLGYFDDLANGPYAQPATIPDTPWR